MVIAALLAASSFVLAKKKKKPKIEEVAKDEIEVDLKDDPDTFGVAPLSAERLARKVTSDKEKNK